MIKVTYTVLDSDGDKLGEYNAEFISKVAKGRHERIQNGQPGIRIVLKEEHEE